MSLRALAISLTFCASTIATFAQIPLSRAGNLDRNGDSDLVGTVTNANGAPALKAQVSLHDVNRGGNITSVMVDERGYFEIYNIPTGEYELIATEGLVEVRERVHLVASQNRFDLRFPAPAEAVNSSDATISVAQYKVPGKARSLFDKAQQALGKNHLKDARNLVDKALGIFPKFAEALTLRGILNSNDGNTKQGQQDLQEAITLDPSYPMSYFALGSIFNQEGHYDDAIRTLTRGTTLDPKAWQGYFELSRASIGKGEYNEAIRYADKAVQLGSTYASIHLVRAHALLGLRQYQPAISEFEAFLTQSPSGPAAEAARKRLGEAKAFVAGTLASTAH